MTEMLLRIRYAVAATLAVAGLAGCGSTSAPPRRDSSADGGSSARDVASASERIKSPCTQIPLAKLNAAFKSSFDPGTLDDTVPSIPSCTWTGKAFDVTLTLLPSLSSDYDEELGDTSDTATYERTQPKFGKDSTFSVDKDLPKKTTLSVLTDDLEWLIDADSAGTGDGRAELLTLASLLF